MTSSQLIRPFLKAAVEDVGGTIVGALLEPKSDATEAGEGPTEGWGLAVSCLLGYTGDGG